MKNLITIEEAIEIAKKRLPSVDSYQEYADAYEFFIDDGEVRIGGAECSFVVEKSGGNILRWAAYFMDGNRDVVEIGEAHKISEIMEK